MTKLRFEVRTVTPPEQPQNEEMNALQIVKAVFDGNKSVSRCLASHHLRYLELS
jgi:hypothetical protein